MEGCKNLRKFAANHTKIKDISPLKNMKNLKELSIQNSPVTDLEIINNFELETFSCSNMKLSHIDFLTKHKKLKKLDLSYNNLVDLTPLKLNTDLVDLNLSGNNYLNDISILRKFKNLKQLELNFTDVTDFSPLLDCKLNRLEINGIKLKTFKYFKNQNHMLVNLDPNFFVLLDNFLNKHISISKVGPKGNLFKVNSYSDNYGIFSYLFDNVS
ncbi:MAG: leucine-rich repeat domain-containing protein [Lentimicrobium sp.]